MNDTSAPMAMPILCPSPVLVSAAFVARILKGMCFARISSSWSNPPVARMTASALMATSSLPDVAFTPTTAPVESVTSCVAGVSIMISTPASSSAACRSVHISAAVMGVSPLAKPRLPRPIGFHPARGS